MRWILLLPALWAAPALGQDAPADAPAQQAPRAGRVVVDYTEVHAGPGAAYIARGRVYQGDRVEVLARSDVGDWIEIRAGGVQGWVRARYVELDGGADMVRGPDGAPDPGRDRRETNYRYDEQGRRVTLDGRPVGSGQGTAGNAGMTEEDWDVDPPAAAGGSALSVRVAFGASQVRRVFDSDIEGDSALRHLEASPLGLSSELSAEWAPLRYLAVRGLLRDTRLAEAGVGANPDFGFDQALALAVEAQQVELDVIGRYPFGPAWAGGYGGLHLLRHAFQRTSPFPIFLTTTYVAAGVGGAAGVELGPVEIAARGGLFYPVALSQDPGDSGDPAPLGMDASAEVAWTFLPHWAAVAHFHFVRVQTDFTGESAHADTSGDAVRTYTRARQTDSVLGGGAGVRWSL